jgi:hypothetical protein
MGATCPSETLFDFQRTTQRYIPEEISLQNYRCDDLKFLLGGSLSVCMCALLAPEMVEVLYAY